MTSPIQFSTPISMANSASLQTLMTELLSNLITLGLTQTTDTGQINPATVTLPAANTLIGYFIFAFPDLSIYFRMQFTTGSPATNAPAVTITVGTGSNGSGTITGQTTTANLATTISSVLTSTTTNYPSYMSLTSDCFWIIWKSGCNSSASSASSFCIEKSVDTSGTVNGLGFCVTYCPSGSSQLSVKQSVRTASLATTFAVSNSFCVVPGNVTVSTTAAGNKQIFLHEYPIPDVNLSNVMGTIITSEASFGTIFPATLVGSTSQNMISMGNQMGTGNSSSNAATWGIALRWQ